MPENYSKSKIAIIGGGNLFEIDFLKKGKLKNISTPYGKANYCLIKSFIFINRHGPKNNIPPHKINHRANIFALKKLEVKFILAYNSVGSLKKKIKPGEFLIPTDYIEFNPLTFYDKQRIHIVPGISSKLRKVLSQILKKIKLKFYSKGVYFQTKGPRLETKAEINLIKNFADVVGMTMAKEATIAKELGLEYASLCSIDNFAHGIAKKPLLQQRLRKISRKIKK